MNKEATGQHQKLIAGIDKELLKGPVLLSYDRFTPLQRTPWAGDHIYNIYKKELVGAQVNKKIGESWEFSCDPDFPSFIYGYNIALLDVVSHYPLDILGPELSAKSSASCEILLKLLNASTPLSLQVHPKDNDSALKENECGKPESWLVLSAEKGSGLYLGFSKKCSIDDLRNALQNGDAAKDYFQFVEVAEGDYFEIAPGVPHAIGAGVTLLEPQRILFGKSGKTYRLWDWGRKYDTEGNLDMKNGKPRELHLEDGLRLVQPDKQVGLEFVDTLKRQPDNNRLKNGSRVLSFPANNYYQLFHIKLIRQSGIVIDIKNGYGALLMLEGKIHAIGKSNSGIRMLKGQPALLPFSSMPIKITSPVYSELALVVPVSGDGSDNVAFTLLLLDQ